MSASPGPGSGTMISPFSFSTGGGPAAVGNRPSPFTYGMTRANLARRLAALRTRRECGELSAIEYRILRKGAALAYSEDKPQRRRARRAVQTAVEAGILAKPACCSWPGDCSATAGSIQGHHEDYSKPLDVHWLCQIHHNMADLALERFERFGG